MAKPRASGRRIRDEMDARAMLAAIARSGMSTGTWCDENGINRWSLYYWRSKLEERTRGGETEPTESPLVRLAEVTVTPASWGASAYPVHLANGHLVEVPADFDEQVLSRLLRVVAAC